MKPFLTSLFFLLALPFATLAQNNADAILGHWLTGTGKAHIEIYKDKSRYYGKIIWLKNPLNEEGKPKVDRKNPKKTLQDRPLMGLVNLQNFEHDGGGEYDEGTIYDPESGKTYSCIMTLKGNDKLNVRGYIGISLIGRTDSWTRVK